MTQPGADTNRDRPAEARAAYAGGALLPPLRKKGVRRPRADYFLNRRMDIDERPPRGKTHYNNLDEIPRLELDVEGFAKAPPALAVRSRLKLPLEERKVFAVLWYDYSCGNILVATQEASITRELFQKWLDEDPRFRRGIERAKEDIADRLQLRFMARAGLIRWPDGVKVNDTVLFTMMKALRPGFGIEDLIPEDPPDGPAQNAPAVVAEQPGGAPAVQGPAEADQGERVAGHPGPQNAEGEDSIPRPAGPAVGA